MKAAIRIDVRIKCLIKQVVEYFWCNYEQIFFFFCEQLNNINHVTLLQKRYMVRHKQERTGLQRVASPPKPGKLFDDHPTMQRLQGTIIGVFKRLLELIQLLR